MGSGISRTSSGESDRLRRRPSIGRSVSSFLVCGASSSSREMDYPAELLINSAEHNRKKKLRFPRRNSDRNDLIAIRSENVVSSGRYLATHESGETNVDSGNKGKCLSDSRELVPLLQSAGNSRAKENASTSYVDRPSSSRVSAHDSHVNGISSQIGVPSSLDEVSLENNVAEEVDLSNSDFGTSFVSDSSVDFSLTRDNTLHDPTPPGLGFLVSEREQIRQDQGLLQVDVVSISSSVLQSNSAETSIRDARRNSRRLFWDAFSRRSSRGHTDSRTFSFSSGDSDHLRHHDRWLLDFSGGFLHDDIGGDLRSHESRTPGSNTNEQRWNSRSEIWERLRGGLDSSDHQTPVCPRGIHAVGSCSCPSNAYSEEPGTRAGISRIVMLAEALFEVLDQIHQQPMSLSLSMVSLPAQESVVNSFPVKIHRETERPESADDVKQCYICLGEYEDGDKIRVLPCHHEYHMSCVDKWLKEIHGVCPLCRGDVREGFTEGSVSN